jgi:hypothetical protein
MPFVILPTNSASGGYDVTNSLRFNAGSSDYLNRTFGTATNRKIFTFSVWVKRSSVTGDNGYLMSAGTNASTNIDEFYFNSTNAFNFGAYESSVEQFFLRSTSLYRDVSAWYHLMFVWDTTNATAGNRARIYVNGAEVTAFSIDNNPSLNAVSKFNGTGQHRIGQTGTVSGENLNGYLAEVIFIDGQALEPTSFGEFDSDTNIWKPIPYTGTFGTNGFYLEFQDSSALGDDTSGNGNDWTVNNLTSIDQTTDTPTNNFATLNPLVPTPSATWSQGNLRLTGTSDTAFNATNFYTIGVDSGKWYTEVKYITAGTNTYNPYVGVAPISSSETANLTGAGSQFVCIRFDNEKFFNASGTASYFASSISVNDIIQVALDMDNGKVWFGKNGTFVGSPTAGTSEAGSGLNVTTMTFAIRVGDAVLEINSGNPPFTISSGNSDANGYGNFEYAVPSGYFALCTKNLADYG